jgi:hypothetical protein
MSTGRGSTTRRIRAEGARALQWHISARQLTFLLISCAFVVIATANPAAAHSLSHSKNYVTTVDDVQPAVDGLKVSAAPNGSYLTITNLTGKTVMVLGYLGEPYVKITPHGVWQNMRAPTAYLNETVIRGMPRDVSATAAPTWRQISTASAYRYHDHRIDWGGVGMPDVVKQNPGKAHLIAHWAVPMVVGGTPVTVTGTLRWKPSGFPEWVLVFTGICVIFIGLVVFAILVEEKRSREDQVHAPEPRLPVASL